MLKPLQILCLIGLPLALELLSSAHACDSTQKNNQEISKALELQENGVTSLEKNIISTDTICQRTQTELSQRSGEAAKGESCHGIRENAAYQKQLNEMSDSCSQQLNALKQKTQKFTSEIVEPSELALKEITAMYEKNSIFQKICPSQVSDAKILEEQAKQLLKKSKATIQKAKTDEGKFSDLAAQTKTFQMKSQGAVDRCVVAESDGSSSPNAKASVPSGDPGRSPASFDPIRHPRDSSTVTGDINNMKLTSASGSAEKFRGLEMASEPSASSTGASIGENQAAKSASPASNASSITESANNSPFTTGGNIQMDEIKGASVKAEKNPKGRAQIKVPEGSVGSLLFSPPEGPTAFEFKLNPEAQVAMNGKTKEASNDPASSIEAKNGGRQQENLPADNGQSPKEVGAGVSTQRAASPQSTAQVHSGAMIAQSEQSIFARIHHRYRQTALFKTAQARN